MLGRALTRRVAVTGSFLAGSLGAVLFVPPSPASGEEGPLCAERILQWSEIPKYEGELVAAFERARARLEEARTALD